MAREHSTGVWFFGCWAPKQLGHFLFESSGRTVYGDGCPLRAADLDARFAPKTEDWEDQRVTALHHVNGCTVLAMWDRTVDTRGQCNAAFIATGDFTEAEMWVIAEGKFQDQARRMVAYAYRPGRQVPCSHCGEEICNDNGDPAPRE